MPLAKLRRLSLWLCFFLMAACSKPDAYDSEGDALYMRDYKGKWIVLNYWADWCKPCYTEMPELNQFYELHRDEVIVLGINFDQAKTKQLNQFKQQWDIHFPLVDTDLGVNFGIKSPSVLPTTVIISPKGEVIDILAGPQTMKALTEKIQLKKADAS